MLFGRLIEFFFFSGLEEAKSRFIRQKDERLPNYILFCHEHISGGEPVQQTIVDPSRIGNIGRYLNHSCDPNLTMHPVRSENMVPHLALFANRPIAAYEELCFNYQASDVSPERLGIGLGRDKECGSGTLSNCHCGAKNCMGFLPYSPDLTA